MPRLASTGDIPANIAVNGMVIYDNSLNCFNFYENGAWSGCKENAPKKCGAYTAPGVWTEFMCHNLGTDESLDPHVPVKGINRSYYQWGKKDVVADVDGAISPWNSTISASDGSWSDTTRIPNDPYPTGYKVPIKAQWDGVVDASLNTMFTTGPFTSSVATSFDSARHYGPNNTTATLTLPATG